MKLEWTIATDRLVLVPFAMEHADALHRMNSDPEVMRYLGEPQTRAEVEESIARVQGRWAQHGFAWWSVFLKETEQHIGAACLQHLAHNPEAELEIGWRLMPEFHGKGYATEAGQAAMDYGFHVVGRDRLCAVAVVPNMASQKVMQRLGMRYVGVQRHYDHDCAYYEIERA